MRHRLAALAALVLVLALASPAPARAAVVPFDARAFAEAQEAGHGVVVFVHAPW